MAETSKATGPVSLLIYFKLTNCAVCCLGGGGCVGGLGQTTQTYEDLVTRNFFSRLETHVNPFSLWCLLLSRYMNRGKRQEAVE